MSTTKRRTTGIYTVHSRRCKTLRDPAAAKCDCTPTYQAWVPGRRPGERPIKKNHRTLADAKAWRADAVVAVRKGELKASTGTTVAQAAGELVAGMNDGTIRNRSGDRYKPSAVRSYERALKLRVLPELGHLRLSDVRRMDVQDLVDRLLAQDAAVSTVKNTLDPVRVIFRRAVRRGELALDPCGHLEIPQDRGRRDRVADEAEVADLLAALPGAERAVWAVALYLGMRRGELRELRWADIDLDVNIIRVRRALDDDGTIISTKSHAGERDVPILPRVRRELAAHKLRTGRDGDDLVFGRTAREPFIPTTTRARADAAWKAAGLSRITLHEGRHTAASIMRAAGLDSKLISAIIGHSSVVITQDRYTHVSAEHLRDAAARLEAHYAAGRRA